MISTPGRLLFEDIVPPEFQEGVDQGKPVGANEIKTILQNVADKSPEKYREISHKLLQLGARSSVEVPASFSLDDLKSPIDKAAMRSQVEKEEAAILARKDLSPQRRNLELVKLYDRFSSSMPGQVYDAAMAKGSNLAKMVASGARGNKGQLNSNIGADWLMLDSNSNPIPIGIRHSYSEGLSPAEYFAAAFGTRRGLISTKFAVQEAGYLSKQLAAAAHDLIVTSKDCDTDRGIPTTPDDKDNVGSVLARSAGDVPAGTVISGRTLSQLKQAGVKDIFVRSPLTCTAHNGVCAVCAGKRERNRFPSIGENLGLAAASSVGEPLSQGSLSEKHSGGVASSSGKSLSAFKRIDQLVQVPEVFHGGASVANQDGTVDKVEEAPQGGHYVHINNEPHYVPRGLDISVKRGDKVEAGDVLSTGTPNPADIVKHKGVGAGRVYFVNAMKKAMTENGMSVDRRNLEVLGRALVNHVKITNPEGYGNHLPDDVVEYSALEHNFEPQQQAQMHPSKAVGKFLAKPTMHYSTGTRITPSVSKFLGDNGHDTIDVMDEHPGFDPEMQRVADVPTHKEDWMAQMAGSNLKKKLLSNVHSGTAVSDPHGTSYMPGLAKGIGFGEPPPGRVGY